MIYRAQRRNPSNKSYVGAAADRTKGRVTLTNQANFREKIQMAFDPPPSFRKLYCKFFIMDIVAYVQGGIYEG